MGWMVSFSKNRFVIKGQVADQAADVPAAEEAQEVQEQVVPAAVEVQIVPAAAVQAAHVVLTLVRPEDLVVRVPAVQVRAQAVAPVY